MILRRTQSCVWGGLVTFGLIFAAAGAASSVDRPPSRAHSAALENWKFPAPPFRVQQEESEWWLTSPEGRKFFSLGVCCLEQGAPRSSFDPENPGYAAWQHYATPTAWADASLRRLKTWGLSTVGGWSDFAALRQSPEQTLWLTPVLHIGSTAGAP